MQVNFTLTHHQKIRLITEYVFHFNSKGKLTKKGFLKFAKGALLNKGMDTFDKTPPSVAQWCDEAEELNRKWYKDQFCEL